MSEISVGSVVQYVPEECHARDLCRDGNYAWSFALEKDGTVLSPQEVKHLRKRQGVWVDRRERPVRLVGPRATWAAVIEALHPDGSADLAVQDPNGVATLHYPRRKQDPGKAPGTWHGAEN